MRGRRGHLIFTLDFVPLGSRIEPEEGFHHHIKPNRYSSYNGSCFAALSFAKAKARLVLLRRQVTRQKGGVGQVYREHRGSVPESERFDLTKIQPSSKLSPKEFAKKIREWMGTARRDERLIHHNTEGNSTERPHVSPYTHREA